MLRPYRGILPTIHPTAFVDTSAQVIGDVHLGAESSVWMNVADDLCAGVDERGGVDRRKNSSIRAEHHQ
jgi:carbonic anhydrase/acetyltransferase-like protein (isoleucine patch superfamily)